MTPPQDSPTSGLKAGTPHFPEVDKLPVKSIALESRWNKGLTKAADGFCINQLRGLSFLSCNHSNTTLVVVRIKETFSVWPGP